jgi:hypothetical protein
MWISDESSRLRIAAGVDSCDGEQTTIMHDRRHAGVADTNEKRREAKRRDKHGNVSEIRSKLCVSL